MPSSEQTTSARLHTPVNKLTPAPEAAADITY